MPPFRPGEFLHSTVDDYDPSDFWSESRVFSFASSPLDRKHLRVCYSVKGRYTRRMEQVITAGREVGIKLPYGDFVIDDASDVVLIAGGTGISAFTAFLEVLTPETAGKFALVYGARTPGLLLFQERCSSNSPSCRSSTWCSSPKHRTKFSSGRWPPCRGCPAAWLAASPFTRF